MVKNGCAVDTTFEKKLNQVLHTIVNFLVRKPRENPTR